MGIGISVDGLDIVRVDAGGGVYEVMLFRQFHGAVTAFDITTDINHVLHAVFAGALDDRFTVFVKIGNIDMRMGINDHRTWTPCPGS